MNFYRTEIKVDVLSEGPLEYDTLGELHHLIINGSCSGVIKTQTQRKLTLRQLIEECDHHNTDPEFFLNPDSLAAQVYVLDEVLQDLTGNVEIMILTAIIDKLERELENET